MELLENEEKIFSGNEDALFLNTFRKYTVTLTLTNKRVIVSKLLARDVYLLEDITSAERIPLYFVITKRIICSQNANNTRFPFPAENI